MNTTNVALLNGPQKDEMATQIRTEVRTARQKLEGVLLTHQFGTYHEYAAAMAAKETAVAIENSVNAIIRKHLED